MYKLNRNTFKASVVEEDSDHTFYYKMLSWQDRLKVTMYLNSIAFRLVGKPEPRLDRTVFNAKSRQ